MNEGLFYGLFFTGILINYVVKLRLESKGSKLERSTVREGLIIGVSAYTPLPDHCFPRDVHPGESHRHHTRSFIAHRWWGLLHEGKARQGTLTEGGLSPDPLSTVW
jgi:hypothetical protein